MKSDGQLVKREMEVYRLSLQESERAKDAMKKQIVALSGEVERLGEELKAEEERSQQLEFDVRRMGAECESWKKRLEEHLSESKTELMAEKKKHSSVVDDLKHDYELKLHHFSVAQKNYDTLQTRLVDAESQLDKAVAQLAQAERLQRSQSVVGETWEQQYRGAMQEVESLRDENAALKSKIRRQYRQIELLTQQSELDSCVSDVESRADQLHRRIMDRSASSVSCNSINSSSLMNAASAMSNGSGGGDAGAVSVTVVKSTIYE